MKEFNLTSTELDSILKMTKKELDALVLERGLMMGTGFYGGNPQDKTDLVLVKLLLHDILSKKRDHYLSTIIISDEEAYIDPYLIDQYNVLQDVLYLKDEIQIKEFFKEDSLDYFDCGQGYYQDVASVIVKIGYKYYDVTLTAEISSEKQDRGDRLYFVESIKKVEWSEIPKPEMMKSETTTYSFNFTAAEKSVFEKFIIENNFKQV